MPHANAHPSTQDQPRSSGGFRLNRRHLIGAATLGSAWAATQALSGCTISNPVIDGAGATPTPEVEPTPEADVVAGATDEVEAQQLLTQIAAAAQQGTWTAPASFAPWCQAVAAMHETHATVLRQRDPLGGAGAEPSVWVSVSPTPAPAVPGDLAATTEAIKQAEGALATRQASRADSTADPAMALVFLSSAVAAQGHRSTGVLPPVPAPVAPVGFEVGSLDQARQIFLSHLDAAIFGYETGLGQMPFADERREVGLKRLDQVRTQRDEVAAEILAASQTPQPASAGYELPGTVGSADEIAALWGNLELATLQSQARLAVALPPGGRSEAIQATLEQVEEVTRWRVALNYWPGWV